MAGRKRPIRKSAVKRAAKSAAAARSDEPTAERGSQSAFALRDHEVEAALETGDFAGILEDYFGETQYAELRQLAREASTRGVRGGPRVIILPGIMGSKIGRKTKFPIFDDVYWVDPIRIALGKLVDMAMPDGGRLVPLGVILLAYLKLKLQLRAAGFDADFHAFDWRRGLTDLGAELKAKIAKGGPDVSFVAHSMGGLVARSAIAQGMPFGRLVMLGTPNFGSFAPMLALRGVYPIVQKIAWLDAKHDSAQLSHDVFGTFAGLIQMLPFRDRFDGLDLYDLANWPGDARLAPRRSVLEAANAVQSSLSPGRDRFFLIAGVGQKTVVNARAEAGAHEFTYETSNEGDGTVPLELCLLPGIEKTWYVEESHGSLPNNGTVGRAVIDILEKGDTSVLTDSHSPDRAGLRSIRERDLRVDPFDGRRAGVLGSDELRHLLDEVASPDFSHTPPAHETAATQDIEPGYAHNFEQVVVGRRRQHRIDLRFAKGSVTETSARAIALGVFSDVTPSGAASALDERLGGAIDGMFRRRMFGARIGEIFILPKGRHALAADFIAFVGLGSFDRFGEEALQTAAENLIRTMINARVEEFATVLFGGGSGSNPAGALKNLLTGFFRGLRDADHDHQFRRIVVCEMNPDRYTALKAELFRLSSTSLCQDVEITFDEEVLPEAPRMPQPARARAAGDPVYLIVRQEQETAQAATVRSSLLTAGSKATIITGTRSVDVASLEKTRHAIADRKRIDFETDGSHLAELVLADQVRAVLPRYAAHHLVVVHDAAMSKVPWEVLALPRTDDAAKIYFPSIEAGLSHRYAAEDLSVAKWLEERIDDNVLNMLLVVNPTGDLDGAEEEGERVRALFAGRPGIQLREIHGSGATHRELLAAFSSGLYDVIHYAGHAFFDARHPEQSGILCHRSVPLTGAQLSAVGKLPSLVFFNACEAARVRGRRAPAGKKTAAKQTAAKDAARRAKLAEDTVGFAEAFMRGGVANFLGTYWPVGDAAANTFAQTFYGRITAGDALGTALLEGRRAVRAIDDKDWADYVFYGSPDFVIKGAAG
jgi:CHAT domain-containing protein